MDEFDYLNGRLNKWVGFYAYNDESPLEGPELVDFIEAEYVPRFESAIWRLSATA